jgi:rhodanese-related sulfurtransferase
MSTVSTNPAANELPSTTVAELPPVLPRQVVLLDVREHDEWAAGHAPDAVHIPMGEVPGRLEEIAADAELLVVCRVGGRSAKVVAYLNHAGRAAVNVDGGMLAWAAAGRPLVTDGVAEPRVI